MQIRVCPSSSLKLPNLLRAWLDLKKRPSCIGLLLQVAWNNFDLHRLQPPDWRGQNPTHYKLYPEKRNEVPRLPHIGSRSIAPLFLPHLHQKRQGVVGGHWAQQHSRAPDGQERTNRKLPLRFSQDQRSYDRTKRSHVQLQHKRRNKVCDSHLRQRAASHSHFSKGQVSHASSQRKEKPRRY